MRTPKSTLLAPITGLECLEDIDGNFVVYVGAGGEIRRYWGDNNERVEVFDHHSVHGIRTCPKLNTLMGFGDKSVVLLQLDDLSVKNRLNKLCDLVLDCCIISRSEGTEQKMWLFIGFAHNFVDIVELPTSASPKFVRRVMGPAPCVLFSLNFSAAHIVVEEDQELQVSSGNVFGAIHLWVCPVDLRGEVEESPPSKAILQSHEGVIFKTRWNKDKSMLVSVADDRTVRVNDVRTTPPKEIFVGWGHISRVWDAVFIETANAQNSPSSRGLIASSSEDGSIRIWDISSVLCLACLKGHNADVWRLCIINRGATLLSGGNDGAVKAWNVQDQLSASPAEAGSTLLEYHFAERKKEGVTIPAEESGRGGYNAGTTTTARTAATSAGNEVLVDGGEGGQKSQTRRLNGTSGLRLSSDHAHMVLVLCNGTVWMVNIERMKDQPQTSLRHKFVEKEGEINEINPPQALGIWSEVAQLGRPVNSMDALFFPSPSSNTHTEQTLCLVSCAHPDGHATMLLLSLCASDRQATWKLAERHCWRAHTYRCTATYIVSLDELDKDSSSITESVGSYPSILTTSIKGECRMWGLKRIDHEGSEYHLGLELSCRTGGHRAEMVTAVGLFSSYCKHHRSQRYLVLGDKRGGVSLYAVPPLSDEEGDEVEVCQYFHKTHGGECVSCFAVTREGFVTGGGDATLCYYRSMPHSEQGDGEKHAQCFTFERAHSSSCLPVTLPSTLVIQGNSLYVIGFHADHLLAVDLTHSMVLMRVEGGSWRRPSHCKLTTRHAGVPGVLFVSVAPRGHRDSLLQVCASRASPPLFRHPKWDLISTSGAGRVNYGATFLCSLSRVGGEQNSCQFVVGGEDGRVRLYRDDLLQFETDLPHNAKIKALSFAHTGPHGGILVAAGSRLSYSVWAWADVAEEEGGNRMPSSMPPLTLKAIQAGSVEPNSTQEHRILCTASLSMGNTLLFSLCDSRGYVYPLTVTTPSEVGKENHQTVQMHAPLRPFSTPVLSCSLSAAPDGGHHESTVIAAFGSSSGQVALWALSLSTSSVSSWLLLELPMHSMGANGVAMSLTGLPGTRGDGNTPTSQWKAIVVSGGDDQAVCIASVILGRAESPEGSSRNLGDIVVMHSTLVRVQGVGGAALKGVCLWKESEEQEYNSHDDNGTLSDSFTAQDREEELVVVTLAADQRVQRWRVLSHSVKTNATISSPFTDESPLQWHSGLVTNITDPQNLAQGASRGKVLVAGEGAQVLHLRGCKRVAKYCEKM